MIVFRLFDFEVQEESEDSVRGSSHQLHQDRVEHLQTSDQVKPQLAPCGWRPAGGALPVAPCGWRSSCSHFSCSFPLSHKFGKKLTYVNYLAELREHLNYEQLSIPADVLR